MVKDDHGSTDAAASSCLALLIPSLLQTPNSKDEKDKVRNPDRKCDWSLPRSRHAFSGDVENPITDNHAK